ncbi:hypothetical protein CSUB01_00118 [Colletotrichum sublineola]|uniref:Uncharacterized protein n=1 Tax=Colletotrichum sublineola TaxID=1173701 RepID=A0A066X5T8_COLSU|nr:hypothetical protein CSUB01_00118 [Colletotrichum sublineola]
MASSVTDGPPRLTETTSLRAERTNTLDAGPLKPYELPISTRRMGLETPLREDYKVHRDPVRRGKEAHDGRVPKLWLKGDRPQPRASSRAILVNGEQHSKQDDRQAKIAPVAMHEANWGVFKVSGTVVIYTFQLSIILRGTCQTITANDSEAPRGTDPTFREHEPAGSGATDWPWMRPNRCWGTRIGATALFIFR